jgi:hypothetical protein
MTHQQKGDNRMKKKTAVLFVVVLTLSVFVLPAYAARPLDLHIEVAENINTSGESFAASGSAVDAGLVCATGNVYDASYSISGPAGGSIRIIHVLKHFVCDGGGTFDLMMLVHLDLNTYYTTARWSVAGSTGDYAGLHGAGSLLGTPIVPGESVMDVYDGMVH